MKVLGLIVEYNPFHNGHQYHLDSGKEIAEADYTVCVMSGNFIQRGGPSLVNKWARARMALLNGADLVIELPVAYALQSAEYFAFGAVKLLDSLNIVDDICFGSEYGDLDLLEDIASVLISEPDAFSESLKESLSAGQSFVKSRELALVKILSDRHDESLIHKVLASPNNILGIEYLKALKSLRSTILPHTIQRFKTGYHTVTTQDEIASATAIRHMLEENYELEKLAPFLPIHSYNILKDELEKGRGPVFTRHFNTMITGLLRKMSRQDFLNYPDVSEGLENRIAKASMQYGTLEEIISAIKTKRYTRTRIQRILFQIMLGLTRSKLESFQHSGGPQYIRVLGMNGKGTELLKHAKKKASLPIITKTASIAKRCHPLLREMLEMDFLATDLYSLCYPSIGERCGRVDLTTSPVIL